MPGIELHADYDRDGRLSESRAERAARQAWPGAIVVANLDRDQRVLPRVPASGAPPPPDYALATAFARDDELVPLRIRVAAGALGPGESLRIQCSGVMHTRVRLSTTAGVIVPHALGAPELYVLPPVPAPGVLALTLQVSTIAGGSFGTLSSLDVKYREDPREESRFELSLLRVDAQGRVLGEEDRGRFSVAPVIFDDCTTPVERLYILNADYNWPSVLDVWNALVPARVPVIAVAADLTEGDAWLQDQYQHGVMQGASRSRQIVVHLPRLRSGTSDASITDNLEEFVNSHFRSRDVALHTDLWERTLVVNTSSGGVLRVSFREIRDWGLATRRIERLSQLIDEYARIQHRDWEAVASDDWVKLLGDLPHAQQRWQQLEAARPDLSDQGLRRAIQQLVQAATAVFSLQGSGPSATVTTQIGGQQVSLPVQTALRLSRRGQQMHHSSNYGGNIESTPPVPGAPLGKLIIGNAVSPTSGAEFVDPDLLRLLAKQKKQPIVELDTTWLDVGHVDEIMAVVPHQRSGFSVLHASSAAALALLRGAEARHHQGLSPAGPAAGAARMMTAGSHPVTRLLRGKAWLHRQQPPRRDGLASYLPPPRIYTKLASEPDAIAQGIRTVETEGPDRQYLADITVSELIRCERDAENQSVNAAIDAGVLARSRAVLQQALGAPILLVPVLFDRISSVAEFEQHHATRQTSAFLPDMANLVVVNGHLLIPKPYGPRMRTDDAIAVVRDAMQALDVPRAVRDRVGRRLVARRAMTREVYWVEAFDAPIPGGGPALRSLRTKQDVKAAFQDSFPGAPDAELNRKLIAPNAGAFDSSGHLRERFSRIFVNDGMVDLFELWTAATSEELGVSAHFVDSWAYHILIGEIHCGTNVLRKPRRVGGINAWDAPDVEFRSRTPSASGDQQGDRAAE